MRIPRAVIVTSDNDLRRMIRTVLPTTVVRTESCSSAEACLAIEAWDEVALLLTELRLPTLSGIALLEELWKRSARLPVVLIADEPTVTEVIRAYELGAVHVLLKPVSQQSLVAVVLEAITRFKATEKDDRHERAFRSLSPREREVADLLLADYPTRQIARTLKISPSTVEKHRAKILSKLQVQSVVGLAVRFFQAQHVGPAPPHFAIHNPTLAQS